MEKPFSQACENNKRPILDGLLPVMKQVDSVLEVGCGTGQHAVFFAEHMPWLRWQSCDQPEYLPGARLWIDEASLDNLPAPLPFEVNALPWPEGQFKALYSANTLHIMSWASVERFFARLRDEQPSLEWLCIYGPFNYNGAFTSPSNAEFDAFLKQRDPLSGIRDIEDVDAQASAAGFTLQHDHALPANNRLLIWQR